MADKQPDTTQNDVENSKISILELQKKYSIQRDSFYAKTRYLRITTWKEGGKAYLDAGQVQQTGYTTTSKLPDTWKAT